MGTICSVARGVRVGGRLPSAAMSSSIDAAGFVRQLAHDIEDRHVAVAAPLQRARVDLVVDVGDVADIGDVLLAIEMAQQPEQHVEHDDRPRIADMGEVVDRRAAHIHAHDFGIDGDELFFRPRQRVVEAQGHGKSLTRGMRVTNFGVSR